MRKALVRASGHSNVLEAPRRKRIGGGGAHPVAKPETQESMARDETMTREPLRLHAFERPMI